MRPVPAPRTVTPCDRADGGNCREQYDDLVAPVVTELGASASVLSAGSPAPSTACRASPRIPRSSDTFLGWLRVAAPDGAERDFYIRQLRDWNGSFEVENMVPRGLRDYADLCGWTLARAHARSGDRMAIAAYLGSSGAFDTALVGFATAYADRNERDHRALLDAIARGEVEAETGI